LFLVDSLSCALKEVSKYLIVDINYYKKESKILEEFKKQKRMIDYF